MEDLAGFRYQDAIKDVRAVYEPAESQFLEQQSAIEKRAESIYRERGVKAAKEFLTQYSKLCLDGVDAAYGQLVDHLMFEYLYSYSSAAPSKPPTVKIPSLSELP